MGVVGGGAAGLAAAWHAAREGAIVNVLERTEQAGKKVLISGGTRCNVLPASVDARRDFVTSAGSERLVRNVLKSWRLDGPGSCRAWLEEDLGLPLKLEDQPGGSAKWCVNYYFTILFFTRLTYGRRRFPTSNSSTDVRDALVNACLAEGVSFDYGASVEAIHRRREGGWAAETSGRTVEVDRLIVATGGLSFPKVGTDGTGYRILSEDLGHELVEPYPALTPLTGRHPGSASLAGISLDVDLSVPAVKAKKKAKKGVQAARPGLLFTHRGFSGPAVLDVSHLAVQHLERRVAERPSLVVQWSGSRAEWEEVLLSGGGGLVLNQALKQNGVPARLGSALLEAAGVPTTRTLSELRKGERLALVACLAEYSLEYDGHEGFDKAEVTGGGVSLVDVDTKTMESTVAQCEGLFLCGEVLDCFGRIGGFNFLWAWVTGRLAGIHAARR